MTAACVMPSDVDVFVLPLGTQPPAWVTEVDPYDYEPDGSRTGLWVGYAGDSQDWRVEQFWTEQGNTITLSKLYVTTDFEVFQLTPEECDQTARNLVAVGVLLRAAIEQTKELAGQV